MFYKKFIGQSGKRVVTLNVIPNELQTPAVKDKDEILIMATTPPVIVPLSLPDRSSQASQPLTLQVFGIIRYDTIQYDTIPSHLFVKRESVMLLPSIEADYSTLIAPCCCTVPSGSREGRLGAASGQKPQLHS